MLEPPTALVRGVPGKPRRERVATYDECPHCERRAKKAFTSNFFPLYTCLDCGEKYCSDDGPPCPECDSDHYGEYDEVVYDGGEDKKEEEEDDDDD